MLEPTDIYDDVAVIDGNAHVVTSQVGLVPPTSLSGNVSNSRLCPPGMEYLINTSMLLVRQTVELLEVFTGIDTNNRYEVLDMGGRRLYLAAEQTGCCVRCCWGSGRPFTIYVINNHGGMCLKIYRRCGLCYCCCCGCCCNKLEIYTGTDVYIGKVTQKFCDCLCPRFTVHDAEGNKCLHITGPCHLCLCCSVHFDVKDLDGKVVGEIHKKWGGIVREAYTTADTFGVNFPMDMDPRQKTLLLGAVFLIDFMYFENNDDSKKQNRH